MFRSRIISGGLAERIEPTTNMDGDAETAIQRIKGMRTEVSGLSARINLLLQEIRGNKTRTNVPAEEVPMEHQNQDVPQDEHQDPDDQAWLLDEISRRTRTEQFPPTSNVTDIHAIERTINLGNTIFTSYG